MGREAFLTMYRGQKWTMAMYCAGQPIQWEDNQSPVFTTSFPQESYNKNRKTPPPPPPPANMENIFEPYTFITGRVVLTFTFQTNTKILFFA